ncbi:MAG: elongation factor P maturation arginine rhamnosyltransferase EarP [Burkholderiales bacterium]
MSQKKNLWRWDIFCAVVDNYGDVGVCWRLARQLVAEHRIKVRLWIDDLASLHRIWPELDSDSQNQISCDVEVNRWIQPFQDAEPADVVIEAFSCNIPEIYVAKMAAQATKPLWINLEYLSAEAWVDEYHALPSPHPFLPLTKYFYFPGFSTRSGGLLREKDLNLKRKGFIADQKKIDTFWQSLGFEPKQPETLRISLFCYENPALPILLEQWAKGKIRTQCLFFNGMAAENLTKTLYQRKPRTPESIVWGNLQIIIMDFIDQDQYDKLLWICDCNFVRGEDSFLRAQWSEKPMIWQIYPQDLETRKIKLSAFLDLYCQGLTQNASKALRNIWEGWSEGLLEKGSWERYWALHNTYEQHAVKWSEQRSKQSDLATSLVSFCKNKLI